MSLEASLKKALEVGLRYPSAHNVQPALVQLIDNQVTLFQDEARFLKVGDPHGFDNDVSLGAFFECLRAGLAEQQVEIFDLQELFGQEVKRFGERTIKARYSFLLRENNEAAFVEKGQKESLRYKRRRSFRGKFAKADLKQLATLNQLSGLNLDWHFIVDRNQISKIADLYDICSFSYLSKAEYQEELYQWLRLSESQPQYFLDGLNRESMALSSIEAWFAKRLLQPSVFAKLKSLGLGSFLVSEAPVIKSSMAIGLLAIDQKLSAFESGQKFVQAWSYLGEYGLYACPLSALSDSQLGREYFSKWIPSGTRLLNVMRIGPMDQDKVYRSPRLSIRDVLIDSSVSI